MGRGVEDMEARGESRVPGANGIVGVGTDPADVKLVGLVEELLELRRQLVKCQGDAVLAHCQHIRAGYGAVGDL